MKKVTYETPALCDLNRSNSSAPTPSSCENGTRPGYVICLEGTRLKPEAKCLPGVIYWEEP